MVQSYVDATVKSISKKVRVNSHKAKADAKTIAQTIDFLGDLTVGLHNIFVKR